MINWLKETFGKKEPECYFRAYTDKNDNPRVQAIYTGDDATMRRVLLVTSGASFASNSEARKAARILSRGGPVSDEILGVNWHD